MSISFQQVVPAQQINKKIRSEDLSSSDIENNGSTSPSFLSSCDYVDEFAVDMKSPPILNRLPSLSKFARPKRPKNQKPPSAEFIKKMGTSSPVIFYLNVD